MRRRHSSKSHRRISIEEEDTSGGGVSQLQDAREAKHMEYMALLRKLLVNCAPFCTCS